MRRNGADSAARNRRPIVRFTFSWRHVSDRANNQSALFRVPPRTSTALVLPTYFYRQDSSGARLERNTALCALPSKLETCIGRAVSEKHSTRTQTGFTRQKRFMGEFTPHKRY